MATNRRRMVAAAVALLALVAGTAAIRAAGSAGGDSGPGGRTARGGAGVPAGSVAGRDPATGSAGPDGAAPVILPGRPGEPARTAAGDQVDPPPVRYNSMDVWFVRMMIPHHTQALQMAALAPQRAGGADIRALADRVRASQIPEIQALRGWLQTRHLPPADPQARHDHATMPGMQSGAAMRRLADARGGAFDRMFVEMMTAHHQGAITMSTQLLRVGIDTTVHQFATSVAAEQSVEIARMRELLR